MSEQVPDPRVVTDSTFDDILSGDYEAALEGLNATYDAEQAKIADYDTELRPLNEQYDAGLAATKAEENARAAEEAAGAE